MIKISNLYFAYRKNESLFDNLSLELGSGEMTGLLGKNGAGKSTLLYLISGLLFPQRGDIHLDGGRPYERRATLLSDLFLIPEAFHVPPLSLSEYESRVAPFYPQFDHAFFEKTIFDFDLPRKRKLTTFSYGQKKKALLSFGLASQTKLLILDEPTNGLDIPSKTQFRNLLLEAMRPERTFLISTHQVRDIETLVNHYLILDDGKILLQTNAKAIREKFQFSSGKTLPTKVVYHEREGAGFRFIRAQPSRENDSMDLELMFNAVVSKTDSFMESMTKR